MNPLFTQEYINLIYSFQRIKEGWKLEKDIKKVCGFMIKSVLKFLKARELRNEIYIFIYIRRLRFDYTIRFF